MTTKVAFLEHSALPAPTHRLQQAYEMMVLPDSKGEETKA